MLERFEEESVKCILAGRDEALRLGHRAVGTEHLLLGIVAVERRARSLLSRHGATLESLRAAIERIEGVGEIDPRREMPFAPDAQRAIAMCDAIAEEYRHGSIAPMHLFLALLRGDHAQAANVLGAISVDVAKVAEAAREILSPTKQTVRRGPFEEDELAFPTRYGEVVLALIRTPNAPPGEARVISLSAESLKGPEDAARFLGDLDRLLEGHSSGLNPKFLRDLFLGLGQKLDTYLESGATS